MPYLSRERHNAWQRRYRKRKQESPEARRERAARERERSAMNEQRLRENAEYAAAALEAWRQREACADTARNSAQLTRVGIYHEIRSRSEPARGGR